LKASPSLAVAGRVKIRPSGLCRFRTNFWNYKSI